MRAGKMDKIIYITRSTTAVDDYGTPSETWPADPTPLPAQIIQASTDEFIKAFGTSAETAIVFRIRYRDDVQPADVVVYEGRSFDLKEIKELGRRQGLELRCVATGGTS